MTPPQALTANDTEQAEGALRHVTRALAYLDGLTTTTRHLAIARTHLEDARFRLDTALDEAVEAVRV